MNHAFSTPLLSSMSFGPGAAALSRSSESLVRRDRLAQYVGNDPEIHREVFSMCHHLVTESLPKMRRALDCADNAKLKRIAHDARGTLGLLGVEGLQELGEQIEYDQSQLGPETWRRRCEELYKLLGSLERELSVCVAA